MKDSEPFSNAGDVLKTLFDRIVPEEAEVYSGFFSGWENIAGSETAMHVVPMDIANGSLFLEADHPGWSQRIRLRQEGLLAEINSRYPNLEIKRFKIRIGDGKRKENPRPPQPLNDALNAVMVEEPKNIEKITPSVAVNDEIPAEDQDFFKLLESMRKRSES